MVVICHPHHNQIRPGGSFQAECWEQLRGQISSFASYVLGMGLLGAQALLDAVALPHG